MGDQFESYRGYMVMRMGLQHIWGAYNGGGLWFQGPSKDDVKHQIDLAMEDLWRPAAYGASCAEGT